MPASPNVPGLRPFQEAPWRVGAVLDQDDPLGAAERRDPLDLEGDVAADVDEDHRGGLVLVHLPLEVVERHAEVVAVAVDELDLRADLRRIASGVAMNVFEGQSTVLPRSSKNSSAASADPVQLEVATDGSPFQAVQVASNALTSGPSDHDSSSRIPSQSACSRSRSR